MLFIGMLTILVAVATAADDLSCYDKTNSFCSGTTSMDAATLHRACNAKYGAFHVSNKSEVDLQKYVNLNIQNSFKFLLMSSHFGNFRDQREGFKKLYRKLSDKTWEDAINLLKYITKRGGRMDFNQHPNPSKSMESFVPQQNELISLSQALEIEKTLAEKALNIYKNVHDQSQHDADIAHYMQEHFLESHTKYIRDLAGYMNDLKNLIGKGSPHVSMFLFDEYLKNSL